MDLTSYQVPRVLVACRSQKLKVEGDGNENVHLYYYINDNIQIQFGREEFCLVTGLRFGVENLADYNDDALPIPFRRWVFLSYLDGGTYYRQYGILQLVLLGVEGKGRIPDWMLSQIPAQPATPYCQPVFPSYSSTYNWQSPILSHMGNPNLEPPIKRHHDVAGLFNQNILNPGKREQRLSFYKRTPYMKQPLITILPKQRGNKNKNNVMKANLSPLNLGNAFHNKNEGGADVKREDYVNYTKFLNDPDQIYLDCYMKGYSIPVTFWQQLVPHLCMPDIDARTSVGWLSEEVFLPIHVGGNHWVMGVIDLPNSHVYVFDYLRNEERNKLLSNQIQRWTPMVNNILQGRGCFNETRGPYNFQFSYNVGLVKMSLNKPTTQTVESSHVG
uniref:Ubiquitin-like protease family profile domain-containing protein n=1 Tax=Tanacetum cinerariifolium TaxID=118510 RepID=A0A6L2NUR3_TANCI|nr:hypothetical protein [Tanacetum cinerariifolium]